MNDSHDNNRCRTQCDALTSSNSLNMTMSPISFWTNLSILESKKSIMQFVYQINFVNVDDSWSLKKDFSLSFIDTVNVQLYLPVFTYIRLTISLIVLGLIWSNWHDGSKFWQQLYDVSYIIQLISRVWFRPVTLSE